MWHFIYNLIIGTCLSKSLTPIAVLSSVIWCLLLTKAIDNADKNKHMLISDTKDPNELIIFQDKKASG